MDTEKLAFYNPVTRKKIYADNYKVVVRGDRYFATTISDGHECWRVIGGHSKDSESFIVQHTSKDGTWSKRKLPVSKQNQKLRDKFLLKYL